MARIAIVLVGSILVAACGGGSSDQRTSRPANTAPRAEDSSFETSEIADISGSVIAADADGDALTYTVTSSPTKGSLTEFDENTGTFTYSPDPLQDGGDSFQFTASDGVASTEEATITIEIFKWVGAPKFGSPNLDTSDTHDLFIGTDGSITYSGRSNATPPDYSLHAWIRRVDRRGNELWNRHFEDLPESTSGGIFENPVGDGFFFLEDTHGTVYYFDDSGNVIWTFDLSFESQTVAPKGYYGDIDSAGNIYAISADVASFFVTKLSGSTGDVIWQREYHSSNSDPIEALIDDTQDVVASSLDFDSTGNLVLAGFYLPANVSQVRSCTRCPFVAGINSDGLAQWAREPESFLTSCGKNNDEGLFRRIAVRSDDTFYVTGSTRGDGIHRGLMSYFSADGSEEIWSNCYEAVDSRIIVRARPLPTVDGGAILFTEVAKYGDPTIPSIESEKIILEKLDVFGEVIWSHEYQFLRDDGSSARNAEGTIVEDSQGLLYATISTDGRIVGPPTEFGQDDVYLVRFDSDGNLRE